MLNNVTMTLICLPDFKWMIFRHCIFVDREFGHTVGTQLASLFAIEVISTIFNGVDSTDSMLFF